MLLVVPISTLRFDLLILVDSPLLQYYVVVVFVVYCPTLGVVPTLLPPNLSVNLLLAMTIYSYSHLVQFE